MIVVDASVALKWVLADEHGYERAREYHDRHVSGREPICVPALFHYEIANVLAIKTKLSQGDVAQALSLMWQLDLEVLQLHADACLLGLELTRKLKITFYDAAYVLLAQELGCRFVTADAKLHKKTAALGLVDLL